MTGIGLERHVSVSETPFCGLPALGRVVRPGTKSPGSNEESPSLDNSIISQHLGNYHLNVLRMDADSLRLCRLFWTSSMR